MVIKSQLKLQNGIFQLKHKVDLPLSANITRKKCQNATYYTPFTFGNGYVWL